MRHRSGVVELRRIAGDFHHADRSESPISQLCVGIDRIERNGSVHIEGVGVNVRRKRADGDGPDAIGTFCHGMGFAVQFAVHRHLFRVRREIAEGDAAVRVDLRGHDGIRDSESRQHKRNEMSNVHGHENLLK